MRRVVLLAILFSFGIGLYAKKIPVGTVEQREKAAHYMLQGMQILLEEGKNVSNDPIMRCSQCKKSFLSFGTTSVIVTAKAFTDLNDGRDTFVDWEPRIQECLALLTDKASQEQITAFVSCVANDIDYPCTKCKKSCWEIMPPKKK